MSAEEPKKPSVKDLAKMNIPMGMPGQGPPPKKAPVDTGAEGGGIKAKMAGMAIPMMMPGQGPPPKKAAAVVEEQVPEEPQMSLEDKQKKLNKHSRARVSVAVHRESRHKYDQLPDDQHLEQYLAMLNDGSDQEAGAEAEAENIAAAISSSDEKSEEPQPVPTAPTTKVNIKAPVEIRNAEVKAPQVNATSPAPESKINAPTPPKPQVKDPVSTGPSIPRNPTVRCNKSTPPGTKPRKSRFQHTHKRSNRHYRTRNPVY